MSFATIEAPQIGQLANLFCRKTLPLQVMHSSAGYYIGTCDEYGLPVSRESAQYWKTRADATEAFRTGAWSQRRTP